MKYKQVKERGGKDEDSSQQTSSSSGQSKQEQSDSSNTKHDGRKETTGKKINGDGTALRSVSERVSQ